jgi:phage gp16-like protein
MKDARQSELAIIHIARQELGLDDETYRAMLHMCARVTSSADLDHAGRAKVIEHLKSRGWKPKKATVANFKSKLIWKVDQLLKEQKLTRAYAEGIAKQMYKRQKIEWCNAQELRGIVAALVKKQKADDGKNKDS